MRGGVDFLVGGFGYKSIVSILRNVRTLSVEQFSSARYEFLVSFSECHCQIGGKFRGRFLRDP